MGHVKASAAAAARAPRTMCTPCIQRPHTVDGAAEWVLECAARSNTRVQPPTLSRAVSPLVAKSPLHDADLPLVEYTATHLVSTHTEVTDPRAGATCSRICVKVDVNYKRADTGLPESAAAVTLWRYLENCNTVRRRAVSRMARGSPATRRTDTQHSNKYARTVCS